MPLSHQPNHALRAGRKKQGLTQEALAEALGVSSKTVGRWERGLTRPSDYERRKLGQVLQQSEEQLGLLHWQEEQTDSRADSSVDADSTKLSPVSTPQQTDAYSPTNTSPETSPHDENTPRHDPPRSPQEAHTLFSFRPASEQARVVAPTLLRRRIVVRSGLVGLALASGVGLFGVIMRNSIGSGEILAHKRVWPLASYNPAKILPIARVLQHMLKARFYDLGPTGVDGSFGQHTMSALHAFQRESNLPVQDIADTPTWEKLIIPSVMNTSGDPVLALQEQLNVRGVSPAVIPDGMFGLQTKNAVISFQKSHQLSGTGQADLDTWCLLLEGHFA